MGDASNAMGRSSVAFGRSTALGEYGVAMGNSSAYGFGSVAIGEGNFAPGDNSMALGFSTVASGDHSTALGRQTNATGFYSTAMGDFTTASGSFSTSMGNQTTASGSGSTSMGNQTTASGFVSLATGYETVSSGAYSTSMGFRNSSKPFASFVIGQYNDSIATSSPTTWVATDPVFMVGNGSADNARNNALTVLKNGNMGISISSPQYGLHVVNNNNADGGYVNGIMVENSSPTASAGEAAISFKNQSFLNPNAKWIVGLNQSSSFRIDYGETFAGGSPMALDTTGNMTIAGILTQNSDARLKTNIHPLQNSLQKILLVNGYQYNWIDKTNDNSLQTGVLAQEVEKQMPELVKTDAEGTKSVNYSGMIPYLIEAVKELKSENEMLKKRIELLEQQKK